MSNEREVIGAVFGKWVKRLGLLWWDLELTYYTDPAEILREFTVTDDEMTQAKVYADWRYATAKILVNLPAFEGMTERKIERVIVHELCHVLVNEMREDDIHHEERVVTGLTKAFLWVESAVIDDCEKVEQ